MGQSGISYLNKSGYSMFWNSMWDNKINYNRNLKEDLFLKFFFNYIFNDNLSINIFLKFNKNLNKKYLYKNKKLKNSFLINKNIIEFYSSKLWVLKYQQWIILYNFIYVINLDILNKKKLIKNINNKNYNFFSFYKTYFKKNYYNINNKKLIF